MASGEDTSAENEKDENFLPPLDKHPTTAKVVMFSSWLEPTPGRFRPRMAVRSETKAVNGYKIPYPFHPTVTITLDLNGYRYWGGYGFNQYCGYGVKTDSFYLPMGKIHSFKTLSSKWMIGESWIGVCTVNWPNAYRHNNAMNVAYMDGHASLHQKAPEQLIWFNKN